MPTTVKSSLVFLEVPVIYVLRVKKYEQFFEHASSDRLIIDQIVWALIWNNDNAEIFCHFFALHATVLLLLITNVYRFILKKSVTSISTRHIRKQ